MDDGLPRRWTWRDNLRWAGGLAVVAAAAAVAVAVFRGERSVVPIGAYMVAAGAVVLALGFLTASGGSGGFGRWSSDTAYVEATSRSMGFSAQVSRSSRAGS